jgi:hypothetical protein
VGLLHPSLAPGERVHLSVREHGSVLAVPFARAAAGVAGFGLATAAMARVPEWGGWRAAPLVVAAAVALALVLRLVGATLRWHGRRLVVTDRRAMLVAGPLRRSRSLPLDDVDEVEIEARGLGRLLHFGGLVVEADGERELLFGLDHLPDPDLVFALLVGLAVEREDAREASRPLPRPLPAAWA